MKKNALILMSALIVMTTGCSKLPQAIKDTSKPIVKVNGNAITQNNYDKIYKIVANNPMLEQGSEKNPQAKVMMLIYKDRIVNDLIVRELIREEAEKHNIQVADKDVNKAIAEIENNMGGKDKLEAKLALDNVSKEDFISNIKFDLTARKLIDSVSVGLNVSDAEVKDFYNKNKSAKFTFPDLVKASHILIAAAPEELRAKIQAENPRMSLPEVNAKVNAAVDEARAKADKIYNQVKLVPERFDNFARQYSEDPTSAEKGGDLGMFSKDQMVPPFSKAAFNTLPGQISPLVQTQYGFHIIKVTDRKKAGVTPLAEVQKEIKQFLLDQQRMDVMQKLLAHAKNTAEISYVDKEYSPEVIKKELSQVAKENKMQFPAAPKTPVKK